MRRLLPTLALVLVPLLAPVSPAQAEPIQCVTADAGCAAIGELTWVRDDFFGDIFGVNNFSFLTPFVFDFTDLTLDVTLADGSSLGASLFGTTLRPGSTTESLDFFSDLVVSAVLGFTFGDSAFAVSLSDADLSVDQPSFGSALIYATEAPAAVPEPGTLALMTLGFCGAAALRRHARAR